MLNLQFGDNLRTNREGLLQSVCGKAQEGITGQILLVPEQFSHSMEYHLCQTGGPSIGRFAEVLSFTRLATRVFSLYGGICRETLDPGGRLLAMSLAIAQVRSQLRLFAGNSLKAEFLTKLLAVVDELAHDRISPAMLRSAARVSQGQFALKLEELSLIWESYQTVCSSDRIDPRMRLEFLRDILEGNPFAAGRQIWIWGFNDFTEQELSILQILIQQAEDVTISLLGTASGSTVAFQNIHDTVNRLRKIAKDLQIPITVSSYEKSYKKNPALVALQTYLFSPASIPMSNQMEGISVEKYISITQECQAVAGKILRLLESGVRLRDIAVVMAEPSGYRQRMQAELNRFQIPAYFSGNTPLLERPTMQALKASLMAAAMGMEQEEVLIYLKSGLSPLEQEDSDQIENYAILWNIHANRWEQEWTLPPEGMDQTLDEQANEKLQHLNWARKLAIMPLAQLRESLAQKSTIGEKTLSFWTFLETIGFSKTLRAEAERLEEAGYFQKAQEQAQLYEIVCQALEQLYQVLGPIPSTPEEFARLVVTLFSQYEVGTIPATLDAVTVGDLMAMRDCQCSHLFVLGVSDGNFPSYRTETGLLTEEERSRLQGLGLPVTQENNHAMDREFSAIYQIVSAPTQEICFTFQAEAPAYLITRILQIFSLPVKTEPQAPQVAFYYHPRQLGALLAQKGIPESYLKALPLEVQAFSSQVREKAGYNIGKLDLEQVTGLYGKTLRLSASRIDKYAACRFSYFLEYGLKAKARRPAKVDAPLYGTFVHEVLEKTVNQALSEGGFQAVSPVRLVEIAHERMEAYIVEELGETLQTERAQKLLRRSFLEVQGVVENLAEELNQSRFQPVRTELEFSARGEIPPVRYHTQKGSCEISGFVDRVDLFEQDGHVYVRVVDYKTGRKSFDYTDILNGIGLQMLIYLFALKQYGKDIFGQTPSLAGVLYMPARMPVLTATSKLPEETIRSKRETEFQRKGLVVSDPVVLEAMEPDYQNGCHFMPYKLDGKGNLTGDLATQEQMDLLESYVAKVIQAMTDQILQGDVTPNPIVRGLDQGVCSYCQYSQVCHLNSDVVKRVMEKTERDEFWKRLEGQVKRHG